jgi:hypothetical protein
VRERKKENEAAKAKVKAAREASEAAYRKKIEDKLKADFELAKKSPEKKEWPLFFITHFENLESILERGIFSPAYVRDHKIKHTKIDSEIVNKRRSKYIHANGLDQKALKLEDFAHTFFNPCNAMLAVVLKNYTLAKIVIIEVTLNVSDKEIYITDRNAAKVDVQCWGSHEYYKIIPQIERETLPIGRPYDTASYEYNDGSKGKVMAECLVQDEITPEHFKSIHVSKIGMKEKIYPMLYEFPKLEIKVDLEDIRLKSTTYNSNGRYG